MIEPFVTRDGRRLVPYDNAAEYFAAHPGALELLAEVAPTIQLPEDGSRLEVQLDLGRELGCASLIKTAPIGIDEEDTFALRSGRDKPSRVIRPWSDWYQAVSTFVVVGRPDNRLAPGDYRLTTAYVGQIAPREPWDKKLGSSHVSDEESLAFWLTHALVWDPTTMGKPFRSTWRQVLAG